MEITGIDDTVAKLQVRMKNDTYRWIGLLLILLTGLLHLVTAKEEASEAAYMGILFGANFLGSWISALGIYQRQTWGWILGLAIAAGSMAGYILSRTVGMPGMEVEEWLNPTGMAAMLVESAFVILLLLYRSRILLERRKVPV